MKKTVSALVILFWLSIILTAYYVTQKPNFLQVINGIGYLTLTISLPLLMTFLSACIGGLILPNEQPTERLILGAALGLGVLGLTGFFFAMLGWANIGTFFIIILILFAVFAYFGKIKHLLLDIKFTTTEIAANLKDVTGWRPVAAGIGLLLAILMGLAPPIEDFDALFYHLTVPTLWLRESGLSLVNMPHYWYPQIVEGIFVWPLTFGVDTATHILHLVWLILTICLLWYWARQLWGISTAWNGLVLLLSMPSLLWLASWAYTDYALTFASLSTMYTLWKWKISQNQRWLIVSGLLASLAVSVKYTGFIVPVTSILLLFWWGKGFQQKIKAGLLFGTICTLVASPWYIRNWVWMGNPIYPFIFGGRYWDSFLADAYSAFGTGIGFDLVKLLTLPLSATLGIYDANYFDGRIGPFFLIISPLALSTIWKSRRQPYGQMLALQTIGGLGAVGITVWLVGVICSAPLFQTRLLFPVLIPLAIPVALGLEDVQQWDLPRLKVSFIFRFVLMLVVVFNLFNFGLQVTVRNPLAAVLGMTSRQVYIEKRLPGYAAAVSLVNAVPAGAKIYALFEPRTYGMIADIQPDSINTNFAHDVWLYSTPEIIVAAWKRAGYTHVLLSKTGAEFMFQTEPDDKPLLEQVEVLLTPIETSIDGSYILYTIP